MLKTLSCLKTWPSRRRFFCQSSAFACLRLLSWELPHQ